MPFLEDQTTQTTVFQAIGQLAYALIVGVTVPRQALHSAYYVVHQGTAPLHPSTRQSSVQASAPARLWI